MAEPWNPKPYMEKGVRFIVERACAGLFMDPGLGKTSISYAAFLVLKAKGMVRRALVVAPLRVCHLVWPAEARKWKEFNGLRVVVLHGPDKERLLRQKADVHVVNYDGLKWLLTELATASGDWPYDVLIVDESSKVKNTATQRFKLLRSVLGKFRRRYILTGSPAPRSLLDLFGQAFVMDQGASLGRYITHYRNAYFYPSGYGGYEWTLQKGAEKKIMDRLAPRVLRMAGEDYLDLPPLVVRDVPVRLPDAAYGIYRNMEDHFRADVEAGRVTAANAGVASLKCRQIANGGLYTNAACTEWQHVHDAKTDAVVDLVEELEGQPTLVAYDFRHDLMRLKKALNDPPHIGGGVSTTETSRLVDAWNEGEIPVLLVNPQSVAHGLNLQKAGRAVIFASLTWNYEDYDQLIRRIWRQGQTRTVFVYRVVAERTVDEAMIESLTGKKKGQQRVFDALNRYWKRRGT